MFGLRPCKWQSTKIRNCFVEPTSPISSRSGPHPLLFAFAVQDAGQIEADYITIERESVFAVLPENPAITSFFRPLLQTLVQITFIVGRSEKRSKIGPVAQVFVASRSVLPHNMLNEVGLCGCQGSILAVNE